MRELVGTVVGERYRLERVVNEGTFGVVFRATHLAYGVELREVALKVAKRPMTDGEARRTFGDALMMARVADRADPEQRRHFVAVHDAGRFADDTPLRGHPYVSMELVRSGSLQDRLRGGPFPLTRAVAYFDQILRAVAFMHAGVGSPGARQSIVHRDLKPANVLVERREGQADILKVSDFGLTIEVDTLLGWVESGGDLAYLAPESFSHDVSSPQSDVYMLALVFYEMLAGRNPFSEVGVHLRGGDDEKRKELRRLHLAARQLEEFHVLDTHEELKQRPALARVVRGALRADMSARTFGTADEFRAAWEAAKNSTPPDPPPPREHAWETVRRLAGEAEQCLAVGDRDRSEALLAQAMKLNRDRTRVPNAMLSGRAYLLSVRRLIENGQRHEAGQLAMEGYQRRRCRSTCLAVAQYYAALKSPAAAGLEREADACGDKE